MMEQVKKITLLWELEMDFKIKQMIKTIANFYNNIVVNKFTMSFVKRDSQKRIRKLIVGYINPGDIKTIYLIKVINNNEHEITQVKNEIKVNAKILNKNELFSFQKDIIEIYLITSKNGRNYVLWILCPFDIKQEQKVIEFTQIDDNLSFSNRKLYKIL
ncbi:MAG: hypothetical protein POELPBGB_03615 [Bacteroidia bacterium]|nr:hypothetical protein [Bacteroidia bacterium]